MSDNANQFLKFATMRAEVVNEEHFYEQGYRETRFGFKIGDRVWFVGMEGFGHTAEEAASNRALCNAIVSRLNAHLESPNA